MVAAGHEVIALAPDNDEQAIARLGAIGVSFQQIPMARTGTNPLADLRTLKALYRLMRRLAPDIVLPYTMKPIIYGGLAARLAGVPRRFALFTGFGFIFSGSVTGLRATVLRRLSIGLYRSALKGCEAVFAYNEADALDIRRHRMVSATTPVIKVAGSGVDLTLFAASRPPPGPPIFLLIARLLREKGIAEFAAAARILKAKHGTARFQILGPFDPSPLSISKAEMDQWTREGAVEYLGETHDVSPYLTASTVFVLPSYYREGIPRSALEALSTGRPIITTNAPGCQETVIDGENGFRVEPRDVNALAAAQRAFLEDDELAARMGANSRKLAEERFDVHKVNHTLLEAMGL
ncbi:MULTISPECIES: glycosyltransferase family 4 protein [Mesorhizobium]|uniref:glycosyltransferase family 4 protein n=2 Tax=Mesorhizobium TaxID=68287 RepID=UPI001FD8AAB6|nr:MULTISPECIES: glycosyltransferase family 4 protein [Mesorhizobium]WJI42007.1 glycosyltransferase family 4 protein [Mesorhizobium opportunistum]